MDVWFLYAPPRGHGEWRMTAALACELSRGLGLWRSTKHLLISGKKVVGWGENNVKIKRNKNVQFVNTRVCGFSSFSQLSTFALRLSCCDKPVIYSFTFLLFVCDYSLRDSLVDVYVNVYVSLLG